MYGYLYQNTDKNFTILYDLGGYDEISLTGQTKVISNEMETILSPKHFGVNQIKKEDIFGGNTIKESAEIFWNIISGIGTKAQNDVVCANAGMAIATVKKIGPDLGFEMAKESLLSGKAKMSLNALIELSKN
jgi:anthranilate phosphoribosyltransferase